MTPRRLALVGALAAALGVAPPALASRSLLVDEPDLRAWQSGLYYADGTPKSSLAHVRRSAEDAAAGALGGCGQGR